MRLSLRPLEVDLPFPLMVTSSPTTTLLMVVKEFKSTTRENQYPQP